MSISVTVEKESNPWRASHPWKLIIEDDNANHVYIEHYRRRKDANLRKHLFEESSYYREENRLR